MVRNCGHFFVYFLNKVLVVLIWMDWLLFFFWQFRWYTEQFKRKKYYLSFLLKIKKKKPIKWLIKHLANFSSFSNKGVSVERCARRMTVLSCARKSVVSCCNFFCIKSLFCFCEQGQFIVMCYGKTNVCLCKDILECQLCVYFVEN